MSLFFCLEIDNFVPAKRVGGSAHRGESHPLCCDCDDCMGPGVPLAPGFKAAPGWTSSDCDVATLSDDQLDALERRSA
jgi:hypothetical protein